MSFVRSKIKGVLSLSLMLMIHANTTAQSTSKNYVQTKTFLDENASTFLRHIDYYDELGVVSETVDVGGNTTNTPIKIKTDYNSQLKPIYQWTPVPSVGYDYIDRYGVADAAEEAYGYYDSPYSEYGYDDFLQLTSSTKPGDAWCSHPVTITRNMVPAGVVKKYTVDTNGNLVINGYHPYGLLTTVTTTDEDGRSMTVFTDYHGNTVLERRGSDNDTYYVYDEYGRLSYVLPPMCQYCSTSELSKYWYKYTYDDRGRCTEKQLPGCDPIQYWYDEANRLQSEQDGGLRSQSKYRNYKYDGIGRLVLQTISSTCGEATESNATVVEVKNYYDDYTSCRQELSPLFSVWADSINAAYLPPMVSRGRLTATLHTTSDAKRYFEMYGYDELGRMTYKLSAYSDKWLKAVHTAYNFIGDVVSVNENVYKSGAYYVKIVLAKRRTVNTYHLGTRLLANTTVTQIDKNGNTSTQTVSYPTYDVFGNVTSNNRPGTAADMTYTYDTLHGWLKGVSSPCGFSEQLQREDATVPLFSGNIGSMLWRNTSNGEQHRYDYTYDTLGRLTGSQYSSTVNGTTGRFDESVTYNPNGSITSLQRNGMKNNGTFGAIDNLTISYDGNQLVKVTDAAEALNYSDALDFHDGDDTACEYDYDSNGALTRDSNRGINSITYDYGHHAYKINLDVNRRPRNILNDYTPDGRKLMSRHVSSTPTGAGSYRRLTITDLYIDGLMLRGDTTLLWRFDGGYVDLNANGTPTCWNYYITDHLGSTRMVVDSNDNIRETINYYPFGSEMQMVNPALLTGGTSHPFRFTGKELDRMNSLNMYDFGARLFDVAGVPMWTSVDPLCEKYYHITPYSYCAGNPVNRFDSDGMEISPIYDEKGKFLGTDDEGLTGNPIAMNETNFKQGMSHSDAINKSISFSEMSDESFGVMMGHYSDLPNRPDYDGYLTIKEANDWYRTGNGAPLFTDLSKIDLSGIKSLGESYVGQEKTINLLTTGSKSINDGLVYGNITLKRYPNHYVRAYADTYDFDMKSWVNPLNWIRNAETIIGSYHAGKGTAYKINIYGSKQLEPLFPWIK